MSLYGSLKLAAEAVALEYGYAFGFPVRVDRCGVMAGAGQFGTPDQGIFSYWIHAHAGCRALRFTGFDGKGKQVRDALHPGDLASLVAAQLKTGRADDRRIYTVGGGLDNAMSLAQLAAWCDVRFGPRVVGSDPAPRPYNVPWVIMDSTDAERDFGWRAAIPLIGILEQIAGHAERNPQWLETSGV